MDLQLNGKRALITGSYRGTGAGLARVLAREGAQVWVHGFETEPAEAVAQSIRQEGFEAHAVAGDIRNDDGARDVAASVGEIDVLVNNYGVAEGGSWESPTEDWINIYHKNVLSGVFYLASAFVYLRSACDVFRTPSPRAIISGPRSKWLRRLVWG